MRDYGERLLQMERQLYDLQTEVNASRQRMVSQAATPSVRPAKIATAPTSGSDKKFGVVFLDGTFDEVIGAGDATFTDRQNSYKHVAYNMGDKQPANGDKVLCYWFSGRWWFAVYEGSSTPVNSEPAINIFSRPNLYYVTGPDAGTMVNSPATGAPQWYGETVHQQHDICWRQKIGNDIGIVLGDAGGFSFTTSQIGTYRFTVHGTLYRWYNYSGAPVFPDPPRTYYLELRIKESKGISSDITSDEMLASATLTTDTNCSKTPGANYEGTATEVMSHTQTLTGTICKKTLSTNTAWRFRGTIYYDSSDEAIEYGVTYLTPVLTVEKLD